jgi:hypothetical protein
MIQWLLPSNKNVFGQGRAMAQAVSHWLPTVAAWV